MSAYTPPPPSTHYATTNTGGMTLAQIKNLARSVKPDDIDRMADLFDGGSDTMVLHQDSLTMAVDNVVDGWKGQAADAASLSVYNTATKSRGTSQRAVEASANMRSYAEDVRQSQIQIDGIPTVDTSYSAALAKSGGPAAAMLNPAGPTANMAAANEQQATNAKQASGYLKTMDENGNTFATVARQSFKPVDPPAQGAGQSTPAPMSSERATAQSFSPAAPGGPAVGVGGGVGGGQPLEYSGARRAFGSQNAQGAEGTAADGDDCGSGDATPGAQVAPAGSGHGAGGAAAHAASEGGSGSGPGAASASAAEGADAAAAGAAAGLPLGAAAGRHAYSGPGDGEGSAGGSESNGLDRGAGRGPGRGGPAGEEDLERRAPRLRGADADFGAERALDGDGLGHVNTLRTAGRGTGALADETELRGNTYDAPGDQEFAAGEHADGGRTLGAGTGRRQRDDDDELDRRPDYLVEPDDLWGDGRLAAPPVLG